MSDVKSLPAPIDAGNWENISLLPFSEVKTKGPWRIQRSPELVWIDQMLMTSAVGSQLSLEFVGRGYASGLILGNYPRSSGTG